MRQKSKARMIDLSVRGRQHTHRAYGSAHTAPDDSPMIGVPSIGSPSIGSPASRSRNPLSETPSQEGGPLKDIPDKI